jgi:hypothetical protein
VVKIIGNPIVNGVVRDDAIVEIPVPKSLVELAVSKDGDDWDSMCNQLPKFGFMNPIGKIHISHLEIDGKRRIFH